METKLKKGLQKLHSWTHISKVKAILEAAIAVYWKENSMNMPFVNNMQKKILSSQ